MRWWVATGLALSISGCTVPVRNEASPVLPPANVQSQRPAQMGTKHIISDGKGGFVLPDGTSVRADAGGGFTLPNGAAVVPDGTGGVTLPNGSRCGPDGAGGYWCP
jgi:hypothetical protein